MNGLYKKEAEFIGKIAISDSILAKPGRLTEEGFTLMKSLREHGKRTLEEEFKSAPKVGKIAMETVYFHHEGYEGTGYPCDLRENEIPEMHRSWLWLTALRPWSISVSIRMPGSWKIRSLSLSLNHQRPLVRSW